MYVIWQLSWQNAPVKLYVITDVLIVSVTFEVVRLHSGTFSQ
jgi:hypothetical protein